jgi:hypothetical protein
MYSATRVATLVVVVLCLVGSDDTARSNCQVCRFRHLSNVYVRPDGPRFPGRDHLPIREPAPGYARSEYLILVVIRSLLSSLFSSLRT